MSFNPIEEKGLPMERQCRSWSDLQPQPYDSQTVPPYTRCRVILMNGTEFGSMWFLRSMARHIGESETRKALAMTRRIEQQQQKAISLLVPGDENTLAHTIGYEQVAVDLTAWLAQHEPDPQVKAALDFGLLEDFDHLYRFANVLDLSPGRKPEEIVGGMTEITVGRPTIDEHRHPFDSIFPHVDANAADFQTLCNIMTIVGAEQQTMNYYMNVLNRPEMESLRGLYAEIGMIEEQHVSQYESLEDPSSSWYKMLVCHEYNECYLYYSLLQQEEVPHIKRLWELHLSMEIEHLHRAIELQKMMENVDAASYLPGSLPEPFLFQSNIDYVRDVLADQVRLTMDRSDLVPMDQLPEVHRFFQWNAEVNLDGTPSAEVIREHIAEEGQDYRFEAEEHPIEAFRDRRTAHHFLPAPEHARA